MQYSHRDQETFLLVDFTAQPQVKKAWTWTRESHPYIYNLRHKVKQANHAFKFSLLEWFKPLIQCGNGDYK